MTGEEWTKRWRSSSMERMYDVRGKGTRQGTGTRKGRGKGKGMGEGYGYKLRPHAWGACKLRKERIGET
jgi:hypothetical protein